MRPWALVCLLALLGCEPAPDVPTIPPPPEDLSTWTVPELVQPVAPVPHSPAAAEDKATSAEKVYNFTPGTTYPAIVTVGVPLDIVLERGEQVRNIVGGTVAPAAEGQAPRLEAKEGADGLGETLKSHVFLTATEPGIKMGLIITSTKRTYLIDIKSVKTSPMRVLRWHYAPDPAEKPPKAKEPGLLPDPTQPTQYHVGYDLSASQPQPAWLPRQIVDDGKKVYIIYPEVTLFDTVPLLRLIGPNGPQLVNARQVLNVVIVDQLVGRAELRVGLGDHAEKVTITRGTVRTIACPGDAACPVWPHAASTLARRQP